ncbi:hypothetical protein [Arthrobacter cryoconiti]|uniref:DUF2721 domain-containing protein n=1 Tax=Arthrobacter cryoconiti TaxID=748907 RepID=A0ABV8QZS3_9MICC|nr:hypothetical protein [Arthrobacter cryoconiti]MCC9068564.1 hypothetical protein [Arthrobacter cryoconiti]
MTEVLAIVADRATTPDTTIVAGVGIVLLIAGITGLWASVHLRGKTHDRLRAPIDVAFEGLTEQAFIALRALQAHLSDILPDPDSEFDPLDMIVDPSTVERPARHSIRVLKERHKIHRQFNLLLGVCTSLMYAAGIFAACVLTSTLLYQFNFANQDLWQTSFWVTALIAVGIFALFIAYTVLEYRIQASIEDSNPLPIRVGAPSR